MNTIKFDALQLLLACDKANNLKVANRPALSALVDGLNQLGATRVLTIGGWLLAPPVHSRLIFEFILSENKWVQMKEIHQTEFSDIEANRYAWSSIATTRLNDGTSLVVIPAVSSEWCGLFIFNDLPGRPRFEALPYQDMTMRGKRKNSSLVTLHDGRVMFIGGSSTDTLFFDVVSAQQDMIFDMTKQGEERWVIPLRRKQPRLYTFAVVLVDGNVLVTGGRDTNTWTHAHCEVYDVERGVYRDVSPMHLKRQQHSGCLLPNGKVFICGGEFYTGDGYQAVRESEEYDPDTDTWSLLPPALSGQVRFKCVLMRDHRVLITGSHSSNNAIEFYDYKTRTYSVGPDIPLPADYRSMQLFGVISLYD